MERNLRRHRRGGPPGETPERNLRTEPYNEAPVADVLPFQPRRTYLDAARAQGVHQEREELLDEHARLTAEKKRRDAVAKDEPQPQLVFISEAAAQIVATRKAEKEAFVERLTAISDAFAATPLAGPHFAFFRAILMEPSLDAHQVPAIFAAAARNAGYPQDEPAMQRGASLYAQRRLGAEIE